MNEHGVRHLLLAGRNGADATGAKELAVELTGLGAEVSIQACDAADRAALAALLASVPEEHPLTGVVHAVGAQDEGRGSPAPEQVDRALRPKVDAAWHLHELTRHLDLSVFVTFSSSAGLAGDAGNGVHAAADAFVDALADHRRSHGLPGASLVWGPRSEAGAAADPVSGAEPGRAVWLAPMPPAEGLALLDTVLRTGGGVAVSARLNAPALRTLADAGILPAVLRGLVPDRGRPSAQGVDPTAGSEGALLRRLADRSERERERAVLELVCAEAASVLGHGTAETVTVERAFTELGFDSLTALELRNRLSTATGLRLPVTLLFEQPTPAALARYLLEELALGGAPTSATALSDLDRLESTLLSVEPDSTARARITMRLQTLLSKWNEGHGDTEAVDDGDLRSASDDELFDLLDDELGAP
uniref:beta-ketoacyl reductase n=1 Tax=Allosalinactinospora lopnorensis TaxID=1352348 RepID=UPI001F195C82